MKKSSELSSETGVKGLAPRSEEGKELQDLHALLIALGFEEAQAKSKLLRLIDSRYGIDSCKSLIDDGPQLGGC